MRTTLARVVVLGTVGEVLLAVACGSAGGDAPPPCSGATERCDGGSSESSAAEGGVDAPTTDTATDAGSDVQTSDADASAACTGQAGTLDESFGDGGVVLLKLPGAGAYAVAAQPDGKLLVGGVINLAPALVRLLPTGAVDTAFGASGVVQLAVGDVNRVVQALAVQPDGKILAAGSVAFDSGQIDFLLARLLPNGALDTTFGTQGIVLTDFAGRDDYGRAIVVRADGKILVGGFSEASAVTATSDFAVARYSADGELDLAFGNGGTAQIDFRGTGDQAGRIALQPDGKVLVVGGSRETTALSGRSDVAVARLNDDGSLDTSFGNGGRFLSAFGGPTTYRDSAAAVQVGGRIVIAGSNGPDFALFGLTAAGSVDLTFGVGGVVTTDFSAGTDTADAVFLQPDGKIVATGSSTGTAAVAVAVSRYSPSGSLDPGFGAAGKSLSTPAASTSHPTRAGALVDCAVVAVGPWAYDVGAATKSAMGIARFKR